MKQVSLDDKYSFDAKSAYITGIEALVRLPLMQHQRDLDAGLNTAGFVSGYRGSPVGTVDQSIWKAKNHFDKHNIRFQPGVNEDLAATAVWGTQQVHLIPKVKYDGVFAMWYGKGPGVDRSMDVIKHANAFGTTRYGGVLAVAGDDHACKSSTVPHQSEHMFIGAAVPVLNPANVQEVLDYGLYGWALSRFSGCWVGLKAITENMDSAISADLDPDRIRIQLPDNVDMPSYGLNAQWPTTPLDQEKSLYQHRIDAARAFALSNHLNRIMLDTDHPRLGIVTSGKTYLDVMEALCDLGISEEIASSIGIRIYKVGMSWPLEPVATHRFAKGLDEILVIEEKRNIIENQIIGQLYHWPASERPRVIGEFDEQGHRLVSNLGELTPTVVAQVIAGRLLRFYDRQEIRKHIEFIEEKEQRIGQTQASLTRTPYFCSGCPHNISTKLPEGSTGLAGIGCHYMVKWMNRNTELFTQMGGEGASWIGQAPFTETDHVFQNIGDGTFFHSGILAIRATIAAGVNITYKILFNDAVAMTGGQPVDGNLSLYDLVSTVRAEGVSRIAVVSENTAQARTVLSGIRDITIHSRKEYDQLQQAIRTVKGTSVIVYDQTCASEKRRRRKRGILAQSNIRVFINHEICEGCGDCTTQSNCLSVLPKQTELGMKRQIDQHACNHDLSCVDGFCPSFVTVTDATLKKPRSLDSGILDMTLPEVTLPDPVRPWNILVTGIGGTGVLTVGSILAMAAHIEGKGCSTLNQTGLAQKFGAVVSHVRIASHQRDIHAVRITDGGADLLLGCDLVVSSMPDALTRLSPSRSHAIVNSHENPTAEFIQDPSYSFPGTQLQQRIVQESGQGKAEFIDATRIARTLLGDSIASNLFMLGYAYQKHLVPVKMTSILQAIALNNVSVQLNQKAFDWGRKAAVNLKEVENLIPHSHRPVQPLEKLHQIIDWRNRALQDYQNVRYAKKYLEIVHRVQNLETDLRDTSGLSSDETHLELTKGVALSLFKLMAYKDEYEIARLYSKASFFDALNQQFEGNWKLRFHMAPPLLSRVNPHSGHPEKRALSGKMARVFPLLAKLKCLRGTPFDIFGKTKDRIIERRLMDEFIGDIDHIGQHLSLNTYDTAIEFFRLPLEIKGFGHVKMGNVDRYRTRRKALLNKLLPNHPA